MRNKFLVMLTGTVLSASVLAGCAMNNDNPNTPSPARNVNYPADPNRNNDLNNNNYNNPAKDKNTDADKDIIKDSNTKKEEIIEDDIDRKDSDTKDE